MQLLFVLCLIIVTVQGGPPGHIRDLDGSWDTTDDDYDYSFLEITQFKPKVNADVRTFASQFYRSFDKKSKNHFYHSNKKSVVQRRNKGSATEASIGKIVALLTYNRNKARLDTACPQLTELYYVGKNGAQYLTPRKMDVDNLGTKGWRKFTSVGYCVLANKLGVCGATQPLLELRRNKNGDDYLYTSSREEFRRLLRENNGYIDTDRKEICYIWQ